MTSLVAATWDTGIVLGSVNLTAMMSSRAVVLVGVQNCLKVFTPDKATSDGYSGDDECMPLTAQTPKHP